MEKDSIFFTNGPLWGSLFWPILSALEVFLKFDNNLEYVKILLFLTCAIDYSV